MVADNDFPELRTVCTRCGKHNTVFPDLYDKSDSEIRADHVCDDCLGAGHYVTDDDGRKVDQHTVDVVNPELVAE